MRKIALSVFIKLLKENNCSFYVAVCYTLIHKAKLMKEEPAINYVRFDLNFAMHDNKLQTKEQKM